MVVFDTMQTVLAVSTLNGWDVKALEFKQAHLNAPLPKIWLELPGGEVVEACKVIYGLRQSSIEWFKTLGKSIEGAGWKSSADDKCLYFHRGSDVNSSC